MSDREVRWGFFRRNWRTLNGRLLVVDKWVGSWGSFRRLRFRAKMRVMKLL